MSCIPGMRCYEDNNPPALPEGVCSSEFLGYPIISSFVYYSGQYLPNCAIDNKDFLTVALQRVDAQMGAISMTEKILDRMVNNPTYNAQICEMVNICLGNITTTTSTTTIVPTTTTTTTCLTLNECLQGGAVTITGYVCYGADEGTALSCSQGDVYVRFVTCSNGGPDPFVDNNAFWVGQHILAGPNFCQSAQDGWYYFSNGHGTNVAHLVGGVVISVSQYP